MEDCVLSHDVLLLLQQENGQPSVFRGIEHGSLLPSPGLEAKCGSEVSTLSLV